MKSLCPSLSIDEISNKVKTFFDSCQSGKNLQSSLSDLRAEEILLDHLSKALSLIDSRKA